MNASPQNLIYIYYYIIKLFKRMDRKQMNGLMDGEKTDGLTDGQKKDGRMDGQKTDGRTDRK